MLKLYTYFCFSDKDWKPFNGPSGPLVDGISAGLFVDGKDSYVGRGTVYGQLAPGTLLIEDSIVRKAGLYIEHSYINHLITLNVEYYAKNPACNYKWVESSNGQTIFNAVNYNSDGYTMYVGRIFDDDSWHVGKVPIETGIIYYGEGKSSARYEVLVCEEIPEREPEREFTE